MASGRLYRIGEPTVRAALGRREEDQLRLRALEIRRKIVDLAHTYPGMPFHLGGSLSCAEIMSVLFYENLRYRNPDGSRCRLDSLNRLVLSKGHAALALWPALAQVGLLSAEEISRGIFGGDAVIGKQPKRSVEHGVELSGGSLGMGLGYASGLALAARRKGLATRVFCLMGDGECDEGSVWEAASFAGHNRLSALTAIVDANGLQLDGPVSEVLDSGPLSRKFSAFGFDVREVDGHDVADLHAALSEQTDRPLAVIAHTVKGRGLSFAENNVAWHDHSLDEDEYRRAMAELADAEREVLSHGA